MKIFTALLAFLLSSAPGLLAGTEPVPIPPFDPFAKGMTEVQFGAGAFFSIAGNRETFNYANQSLRIGRMLTAPQGRSFWRGNLECMVELFADEIFEGPKTGFLGAALIGRYNFLPCDSRWIPYLQIGGGGLLTDVYRDRSQRIIGSGFEFILRAGAGLRWKISARNALFAETEYQHISNANTASRNVGLNTCGVLVGFSHFF